ncbi:hypothetical protein [Treponema sp.]|uniref:hypothetical protein n=1 Tax=Treponema sp. TaxID=166 RepID=UPI00388F03A8
MRADDYEPEHYRCSECKHFRNCKRVDNDKVKFAKVWFLSEPNCPIVCCDFELRDYMIYAKQNWIDFETYWREYVENWLPYGNTDRLVYFTLNGDTSIRYGVRMMDYVYGYMYSDNKLNAVEKMYYKQTRGGFGYKLIREGIEGVSIE